jgi:predicted anti-sigma-YlaC factor YlaD
MGARKGSRKRSLSCDDHMRMPLSQEVIEHIRSCEKCRALFNQLGNEVDRRAYGFEHRN